MMKIKTLYADPPWRVGGGYREDRNYSNCKQVKYTRPSDYYSCMDTDEIKEMKFLIDEKVDEQAHLYLWVVSNRLPDGLEVMKEWGFKYITNIVWVKNRIGMGNYFRTKHEICLFGIRGKSLPYKNRGTLPSALSASRTKHSKKPEEFYDLIEKVSYPPYLELFARNIENPRPNWSYWGNEVNVAE